MRATTATAATAPAVAGAYSRQLLRRAFHPGSAPQKTSVRNRTPPIAIPFSLVAAARPAAASTAAARCHEIGPFGRYRNSAYDASMKSVHRLSDRPAIYATDSVWRG